MFQFSQYRTPPDLQGWIRLIWALTADGTSDDSPEEKSGDGAELVVPDGHPELIFNLGDPFAQRAPGQDTFRLQPAAILNGQLRASMMLRATGRVQLVGIRLQPWALGALTRTPASRLSDQWIAVGDAGSRLLPDLADALAHCQSHAEAFHTVVAHLRTQLGRTQLPPQRLMSVVSHLSQNATVLDLSVIRNNAGLSERVMQRMFENDVGLTPKQLAKITRIQHAVRARRETAHGTWARAALDAGYYDQSHFNKDFRAIVGCTPTELIVEHGSLTGSLLDPSDNLQQGSNN